MIHNIRLQNFRSYGDAKFTFSGGTNIIAGPNASGKTNLLEAVMVLARGSSFRAKDIDLLSYGANWARLDGQFGGAPRTLKLRLDAATIQKELEVGQKIFKRPGFGQTVPVVYFEPNHLNLITAGPSERRQLIDELLELTDPGYKKLSASYRRTLAQRNALLKRGQHTAKQQMFAWDVRLAELGGQVANARQQICALIDQRLGDIYSQIAGKPTPVELKYKPQFPLNNYASQMVNRLSRTFEQDILRGFSGSGPHREDAAFKVGSQPIGLSASRGEVRSLFLALKIIELSIVEQTRGQKPILLLDDVFSELDVARRRALIKAIKNYQSILTTTEADALTSYFKTADYKLIKTKRP